MRGRVDGAAAVHEQQDGPRDARGARTVGFAQDALEAGDGVAQLARGGQLPRALSELGRAERVGAVGWPPGRREAMQADAESERKRPRERECRGRRPKRSVDESEKWHGSSIGATA
jgi:hypothetical protein